MPYKMDMDMRILKTFELWLIRALIWRDTHGQDLIEYALMAGFVAISAGAIMPGVATSISRVFSKVASTMSAAAATS